MKIAVSATGGSMNAQLEPRFGRCAYFVIVDSETMKFTAFSNPASELSGGAGPAASREIVQQGAEVVITGRVGGNAETALNSAGVKIVTGYSGTVKDVIDAYLKDQK
ncbi:NifB/NifX family molybdenum-iron cluster-binding protein [candidate division KSB1 bacterium]|nr:NifB/NifX family molybdenum-iron cluster-binding protein [candidate division KSB1 bacterium]